MPHDQPPHPNHLQHLIHLLASRRRRVLRPAAIPQRPAVHVQAVLLGARVVRQPGVRRGRVRRRERSRLEALQKRAAQGIDFVRVGREVGVGGCEAAVDEGEGRVGEGVGWALG